MFTTGFYVVRLATRQSDGSTTCLHVAQEGLRAGLVTEREREKKSLAPAWNQTAISRSSLPSRVSCNGCGVANFCNTFKSRVSVWNANLDVI